MFQYVFIEIHQSVKGDRLIDTFLVYTHGNGWIELISRYNENGNSGDSIVPRFQNSSFLWKFELNLLHSVLKKISLKIWDRTIEIIRMMINLISHRAHINKLNMISYHYWLRKKSTILKSIILQLKNERESKNKSKKLVRLRNKKRRMMLSWIVFHRFVARPWNDQS